MRNEEVYIGIVIAVFFILLFVKPAGSMVWLGIHLILIIFDEVEKAKWKRNINI